MGGFSRRRLVVGLPALTAACGIERPGQVSSPAPATPAPARTAGAREHTEIVDAAGLALGPVAGLSETEHLLYVDPEAFAALPAPREGAWRHRVHEPAQTFADFVVSRPNPLEAHRRSLYLLPWGTFPHEVIVEQEYVAIVRSPDLAWLAEFASLFFGVPVSVLPARSWEPGEIPLRIRGGHDQLDALALLAATADTLPDDAHAMAVLVNRDLHYDAAQDYAFGYGTHRDRLAVMSFARFDPQFAGHARTHDWPARITDRSLKVLAHEVAHTFGLRHCTWYACLLNGFAHLEELDATPLHLCPVCLRKLHFVTRADLVARYRGLHAFYGRAAPGGQLLHAGDHAGDQARGQARDQARNWIDRRLRRVGHIARATPLTSGSAGASQQSVP